MYERGKREPTRHLLAKGEPPPATSGPRSFLKKKMKGTGSVPTDSHVHTRSGYNAQKDLRHRAGVERRTSALQPRTLVFFWEENEGARPAPPARLLFRE